MIIFGGTGENLREFVRQKGRNRVVFFAQYIKEEEFLSSGAK